MAVVGVGIDVVDVARAARLLERRPAQMLGRLLTEAERAYVEKMKRPAAHLAVRLAAKEAVYKALQILAGARGIGWQEIEVVRGRHGRPTVALTGLAARLVGGLGRHRIHLSLTHSELSAAAVAVVEQLD